MPMEPQVNQQQVEPTEKAQIVIHYMSGHPSLVVRYNNVNTAKKDFSALCKLRKAYASWDGSKKQPNPIFTFASTGVMFECQLNVRGVAAAMFIEHAKRNKFVPIP